MVAGQTAGLGRLSDEAPDTAGLAGVGAFRGSELPSEAELSPSGLSVSLKSSILLSRKQR